MKIKSGFVLNKLGNQYVVVAVGDRSQEFQGMIKVNETASFLWNCLQEDIEEGQVIERFQKEYDLSYDQARSDVVRFLSILSQEGLLVD